MRAFLSRLLEVMQHRSRDHRLHDEVETHLELLTNELVARGLSCADARLAACKAFGGVDQIKEQYRDQRGLRVISEAMQDTRYALRLIRRDRWFTAATVVALALGIGVSATMVTLLYSMNLRGLPFHDAQELVGVTGEPARSQGGQIPYGVFQAWRATSAGLVAVTR